VFVDQNNILYFSSDGQPGLGGLDVFALDLNDPEAQAYNLGAPINTGFDDFAYSIQDLSGFVSSNRGGLTQSFGFSMDQPLALVPKFDAQVALTNTQFAFGTPLELTLYNDQGTEVWKKTIQPEGETAQVVIEDLWKQGYRLTVSGGNIVSQDHLITVNRQQKSWSLTAAVVSKNKPEVNFLDQFGLSPILFDFNQSVTDLGDIKTLADRLQYAQSIVLEGHSDQIGTARYNKRLSIKRAEFVKQALVDAGVKATLIHVVGYGEKKLLNNCRASGCSPEQEQANRRVEVKVVF
jgi:outer membrane protein OmpA-like peptidoglycan-associated protein